MEEGNPIKYSQLFIDDGAVENLLKAITDFEKRFVKSQKTIRDQILLTQKATQKLTETNKEDEAQLSALEKQIDTLVKENKKLQTVESDATKVKLEAIKVAKENAELKQKESAAQREAIKLQKDELALKKAQNKETEEQTKKAKGATGAYKEQSKQLNDLRNKYKDLAAEEKGNTKEAKALLQQVQQLDTKLKAIDATVGQFNRNVGNYKESVKEALQETDLWGESLTGAIDKSGLLGGVIAKLTTIINVLKKQFEGTAVATEASTVTTVTNTAATETNAVAQNAAAVGAGKFAKAFKILNAVMKAGVIGLIIVALGSLVSFFTRTANGINKAEVAMEAFGDIVGLILDRLGKFGGGLFKIFAGVFNGIKLIGLKAQQAFLEIKAGLQDLFGDVAPELQKQLNDIAKEIDGLNPGQQIAEGANAIAHSFDGVADAISDAFDRAEAFVNLKNKIRALNEELENSIAKQSALANEQKQIADDATIGFKKRFAALKVSQAAEIQAAKDRLQIAKNELQIQEAQNAKELANRKELNGKLLQDDVEATGEKNRAVIAAASELQLKLQEFRTQARQIEEDQLDNTLDILQDGLKAQEDKSLKEIANEKEVFDERRRLLEETTKLSDQSFRKQIALIQQFSKEKIDADALVNEKDAEALAEKIKALNLSDKVEKLLLKTVKERVAQTKTEADAKATIAKQQEAALEKLLKLEEDQKIALIQNDKERADTQLQINTDRRLKEIEDQQALFAIESEEYQKFEDLKTQIKEEADRQRRANELKAFEDNLSQQEKLYELSLLKNGESQKDIDTKLKENKISGLQSELDEIDRLQAQAREQNAKEDLALTKTRIDKELELERLKAEQERELQRERLKLLDTYANQAFMVIDRELKKSLDANEKKVEATQTQIQKQQDLAQEGAANTLAFEEAQAAKLQAEKAQLEKKQIQLEKVKALYSSYSSKAAAGDQNALANAFKDLAILSAIESTITKFGDGGLVEDALDANSNGSSSRGSIQNGYIKGEKHSKRNQGVIIAAEGDEGIFSGKEMGNLGKENFWSLKQFLGSNKIGGNFFPGQSESIPSATVVNVDLGGLKTEMRNVKKAIENQEKQHLDVKQFTEKLFEIIETKQKGPVKVINRYRVVKPRI